MRVRYVRPLTAMERQELESLQRHGRSASIRRRAHFILLSANGHCLAEAAGILRMARSTAGRVLNAFEGGGLTALVGPKPQGRPSRVSPEVRRELTSALEASPREVGFPTNNWTSPLLVAHLQRQHGITLSEDQALRLMRTLGFRRVRPRPRLAKGEPLGRREPAV